MRGAVDRRSVLFPVYVFVLPTILYWHRVALVRFR